jgi:hypothetical protein
LATIHQMVTAWPGSSPVVSSEKETPLPVRVSVEVPALALSPMRVTSRVVWVAAPARPSGMANNNPRTTNATRNLRFTTASPRAGGPDAEAGVSANWFAPSKLA